MNLEFSKNLSSRNRIINDQILLSSNRLELSPWSFTHIFKKIESTMRWNYMSKPLRFLLIMAEHQDCPFFTVFITIKPSSQNISIVLLQISPKLNERWGGYWRKRLPWMILEEQFPVLRNTAKSKKVKAAFRCYDNSNVIATLIITNFHLYLIQLCWQFFQIFVYGNLVYAKTWGYFPWKTVSSHLNILRVTAWEGRFIEIWLWLTCLQRKD